MFGTSTDGQSEQNIRQSLNSTTCVHDQPYLKKVQLLYDIQPSSSKMHSLFQQYQHQQPFNQIILLLLICKVLKHNHNNIIIYKIKYLPSCLTVVEDIAIERGSSSGILSPGAIAGVIIGLVLSLSLAVTVILTIACLVRHRNSSAQSENVSTLTSEGLSFGMGISEYYTIVAIITGRSYVVNYGR